MDLAGALPALGAAGGAAAIAIRSPELLKEIYGDLAKPGVSQVGKAIGSILGLGNSVLIPLRLLNQTAAAFERRYFGEIADRFSSIPDAEVVEPPPEIALPIIERLSYTNDDNLRKLFVELLAKASTSSTADRVHPSFAQVLGSLAPDEAILLKALSGNESHPLLSIRLGYVGFPDKGHATLEDLIFLPPSDIGEPKHIPLFLSNLSGLGIIEIMRDIHLASPTAYDEITDFAKSRFKFPDTMQVNGEDRNIDYQKFICKMSPYGHRLLQACLTD